MNTPSDTDVRLLLYRKFVQTGQAPTALKLAQEMQRPEQEIRDALERLATGQAIVLQPESREILMATPLCAVPSPFQVRCGGQAFFGSCVWDALGVIGMLNRDGTLESSCACCGEAMRISIRGSQPASPQGIIHFAIPARRWWENIVFT